MIQCIRLGIMGAMIKIQSLVSAPPEAVQIRPSPGLLGHG